MKVNLPQASELFIAVYSWVFTAVNVFIFEYLFAVLYQGKLKSKALTIAAFTGTVTLICILNRTFILDANFLLYLFINLFTFWVGLRVFHQGSALQHFVGLMAVYVTAVASEASSYILAAQMRKAYEPLETDAFDVTITGVLDASLQNLQSTRIEHYCENHVVNSVLTVKKEAARQIKDDSYDKAVVVKSDVQAGFLMIKVENTKITPVKRVGKTIKTSKKDEINHGLGLQLVHRIAEKYDGLVRVDYNDMYFSIRVSLHVGLLQKMG